jgi:hypothetical protein
MLTLTLMTFALIAATLGSLALTAVLVERADERRYSNPHRQVAVYNTFSTYATLTPMEAAKDIARRTSVEVDALLYDLMQGSCFEVHGLLFTPSTVEDPTSVLVTYA